MMIALLLPVFAETADAQVRRRRGQEKRVEQSNRPTLQGRLRGMVERLGVDSGRTGILRLIAQALGYSTDKDILGYSTDKDILGLSDLVSNIVIDITGAGIRGGRSGNIVIDITGAGLSSRPGRNEKIARDRTSNISVDIIGAGLRGN